MEYKEKYLKYKKKYLLLKNQSGGMSKQDELDLAIDFCVSYVTEIIGDMDLVLESIIKYKSEIENMSKNSQNNDLKIMATEILDNFNNIQQLKTHIVGRKSNSNIYMHLFYFVEFNNHDNNYYIKSLTRENRKIISRILNINSLAFARNSLIILEAQEGVHWIYIDNNLMIHNPYNYNMQIDHSHQFCQTHSLLMALIPKYRRTCNNLKDDTKTADENDKLERVCSYKNIINLLKIILHLVIRNSFEKTQMKKKKKNNKYTVSFSLKGGLHEEIINEIRKLNLINGTDINSQENNKFVNDYINDYLYLPTNQQYHNLETIAVGISKNIINILEDPRAMEIVPDFYDN